MSKAFVREDDGGGEEDREEEPVRSGPSYITPAGAKRLQDEIDALWKGERPRVTAEVAAAAAQGDRSENAEYIYGKKRLREIDRRLRFLRKRLEACTVVEPSKEQAGRVFFGAWVTVEDEDGTERTVRIVGVDEIDLGRGWISFQSPLARALLGRSVGDEATVAAPKGPTEYTVVAIRYEAE